MWGLVVELRYHKYYQHPMDVVIILYITTKSRRCILKMEKSIITELKRILGSILYISSGQRGLEEIRNKFKGHSGIYILWNKVKKILYVGCTSNIHMRLHFYKNNYFPNKRLEKDIMESGWESINIIIVKKGKLKKIWEELEYENIKKLNKVYNIYNVKLNMNKGNKLQNT